MVASHRKLTHLLLDQEVVQILLLGELITESDAIVIDTETDQNGATEVSGCFLYSVVFGHLL